MEPQNLTAAFEFLLLGVSNDPKLQPLLFGLFLTMYLATIVGNVAIISAVRSDSHLHTPMYFFLSNLSLADIGFTSSTVPKMLVNIETQRKSITYTGCLIQVFFYAFFGCLDSLFLTVMAYDRFVAICNPLHYTVIMNPRLCHLLVLILSLLSLLQSALHVFMMSQLTFCNRVEIPQFFCDPPQILKLACSDTFSSGILLNCIGAIYAGIPALGILFTYVRIVSSILKIPSAGRKYKAFSTCGSHLSVVCLFYGTVVGVYLSSTVVSSSRKLAVATVMYTVVTPMLNPFIYSLRNKDIKTALRKLLRRMN
ncbi:olfactory receptor 18-like [Orycteropus afer afer]|uniref:Olfactory receptor n=1 Tax=Orycteropus afer afer TaxID=1230840 RepID=A0A8B7B9M5_ORYAF|nr:olfactory receptor 18-like [Orycteropus afer afer]